MSFTVVFFDVSDKEKDFGKGHPVENGSNVNPSSTCAAIVLRPTPWKVLVKGPLSGEENMGEDVKMFELQRESNSVPVVRLYRWVVPTVTYGRLQPRGAAEAFAAISGAKAVVQRPTGGGMVFHDSDLSFSVVWRRGHPTLPPCIKNVYRLFHEAIAKELRSVGISVSLHQTEGSKRTPPGSCYQEFSRDDILWENKKIVGGALRVTSWGRLYQGNIKSLISMDPINWEVLVVRGFERGVFLSSSSKF